LAWTSESTTELNMSKISGMVPNRMPRNSSGMSMIMSLENKDEYTWALKRSVSWERHTCAMYPSRVSRVPSSA
jgi:hypothetical protein